MNGDEFELLELTFDRGIQISRVRQAGTGRLFQIHAFHGGMMAEFDRLCADLQAISAPLSRVVETSREAGAAFIRTEPLPDGIGIQGWVAILRAAPSDTEAHRILRLALQFKLQREAGRRAPNA